MKLNQRKLGLKELKSTENGRPQKFIKVGLKSHSKSSFERGIFSVFLTRYTDLKLLTKKYCSNFYSLV